jgi:hypothetical protein
MRKIFLIIFLLIISYFFYSFIETEDLDDTTTIFDNVEYKNCIANKNSEEFLSDSFYELEDELNELLEEYNNSSVIYQEINSNYIYEYDEDKIYYGASTIKAPFALTIYKKAEETPSILDKVLHYKTENYIAGTGIIRYQIDEKTDYTVRELVKYMIEDSDNIGYYMLLDEFDKYESKEEWNELGTTTTFTGGDKFSVMNATDANIYMNEIYKYLTTDTTLSKELATVFKNASKNSIIKKNLPYDVYFKYGWYSVNYHEMVVVLESNPYTLIIMTTAYSNREEILKNITELTLQMHIKHWNDLLNNCMQYLRK